MADEVVEAPVAEDEEVDAQTPEFDPCSMPLGTFAAFPVSDQPEWLPFDEDATDTYEYQLDQDQTNTVNAMVRAVAQCEPTARRLEVQNAWRQELMDAGHHNLRPTEGFGWEIDGSDKKSKYGLYGTGAIKGNHAVPTIGAYNDILVAALTRDVPRTTIFPKKPDDDGSITSAAAGNKLKHFIANDNNYQERCAEIARFFCTDDRVVGYMAPWADAQMWGYEDGEPLPVPETEDASLADGEGGEAAKPKRPKIRSLLKIYGKLNDKCPIMARCQREMPWRQISYEIHKSMAKAMLPWAADKIKGAGMAITEIALDRVARCTVNLALERTTGDSIENDTTMMLTWIRPEFYMDDSCPKAQRGWFWKTYPKGFLAVHAGDTLGFVRNESMDEVLEGMHSRSGQGQNRRSLTEAYISPQLRLNNWVDLLDEFFRKTIPRVGLRNDVWNVDAIRNSSVRVGTVEPFILQPGEDANQTVVQFPMPTHQPTLPDFIKYFATELAELLTGAMPSLSASQSDDPETLGQSRLQNANAMGRLAESWKAMCGGLAQLTVKGIRWAARVQPDSAVLDSQLPGSGRMTVKIADLQMGEIDGYSEGDTNFPETQAEREARWVQMIDSASPLIQGIVNDPRNSPQVKQFMPEGTVVAQADAVEKQQGEFEVLLTTGPIPNPKKAALEAIITKLTTAIHKVEATQPDGGANPGAQVPGQPQAGPQQPRPVPTQPGQGPGAAGTQAPAVPLENPQLSQMQAMLQQATQIMEGLPDQVSSVPVRADGSENDAVEALVCLGEMNSPEGRRLSVSKSRRDVAAWQNLMLHWQEHEASDKQQQAKNMKPLVPKVTATVAVDKLAAPAQAKALSEMGLPIDGPQDVEQPLEPHEVVRETEGVNPAGAPTKETISMSGKKL